MKRSKNDDVDVWRFFCFLMQIGILPRSIWRSDLRYFTLGIAEYVNRRRDKDKHE